MAKITVSIGDKVFRLISDDFDEDIDVDTLLKIDYSNLLGELITFPVIVNKFGRLLADCESKVSEDKLNLDIFESKLKEKLRIELQDEKGKAPTVDALNNAVLSNVGYQALRKKMIKTQKTRDYVNSVFWSAKDKSAKLDKLSLSVNNTDLNENIIEGKINGVMVKKNKPLIS